MLEAHLKPEDIPVEDQRLHLLSKELEEATKLFLHKMAELEKMLPLIEE
jgi:hypothetical protein